MKRMLTLAAAVLAASVVGYAQGLPQSEQKTVVQPEITIDLPRLPSTHEGNASVSSVEQRYVWFSRHFSRVGPDDTGAPRDSNEWNFFVPTTLTLNGLPAEQRGVGEIFAPNMYYPWFGTLANDTTNLLYTQAYYDQFKDSRAFTIDSIQAYFFRNPNVTPTIPAKFVVYSTPTGVDMTTYFNSTNYQQGGFFAGRRQNLTVRQEIELTPEDLNNTVDENVQQIVPTVMGFDPPLVFDNKTAAVAMFINDDAPAVNPANIVAGNSEEYEVMRTFWEYRTRSFRDKGAKPGIAPYKALGVLMIRQNGADSVYGMNGLTYTFGTLPDTVQARAAQDAYINFVGSLDIVSGVKYHFGRETGEQGLGNVTPNPVTTNSRLPFSLTELADVQIDLYDVNGRMVKNLVSAQRWVPGNYSVELPVNDLENGAYLVRMTANGKPYSMKFTVAR